ncbi:MAG: hypothetical protein JF888_08660 [Candidatus Dormibacteraeota bacterium]|uniref:DUF4267 domain-containing protein n=1 Tax=Candidatus Dormiibacter inghamiae TaxID=3127013 RepID=A0A934KGU3_9BACT|nr:hypothetical protein [Candidatus Dormibacteraeota bacterium]MBJ7607694.1 hypothetical protein [Candidatus Dormibacteraeota bacterium]
MTFGPGLGRKRARACLGVLAGLGFALGAGALIRPELFARAGGQPPPTGTTSWPWRLFAVRELGLAWALFDAARRNQADAARTAAGWLAWSQAGDAALSAWLGVRNRMPRRLSILVGLSAASTFALAAACRRAYATPTAVER